MLQDRFDSQTRAEIDTARIEIARARLDRAEQIMLLRKTELASLAQGALQRPDVLVSLKLSERAVFNRRLELDLLLRTRRRRQDETA